MEWLSHQPTGDEICKELVMGFFISHGVNKARIVTTDEDGNITYIGDFGFEEKQSGKVQGIEQWQNRTDEIFKIDIGPDGFGWSSTGTYIQARVDERAQLRGWITLGFSTPQTPGPETEEIEGLLTTLKHPIGLYLALTAKPATQAVLTPSVRGHIGKDAFTQRQLSILQGMIEGKTNHELASDLGFSVSTIRHETMRIYQLLAVSDRREAAREALDRRIF
jgi:DNA-binding CsgD family transcriptional regulator